MLSIDVQRRLVEARLQQAQYQPKDEIRIALQQKKMILFVGPSAAGKTFIMQQVKKLDPRFSLVSVFTTREAREDDDPELFRILPHTDQSVSNLLDRIESRELVQYAVHPTQGHIYGTELSDYQTEYNLLASFSGAVEQFHSLPFQTIHTVSVVPKTEVWKIWFNERYPTGSPNRQKRLEEALISLDWLMNDERESSVLFVENIVEDETTTARLVIEAIVTGKSSSAALDNAFEMRTWIKSILTTYTEEDML